MPESDVAERGSLAASRRSTLIPGRNSAQGTRARSVTFSATAAKKHIQRQRGCKLGLLLLRPRFTCFVRFTHHSLCLVAMTRYVPPIPSLRAPAAHSPGPFASGVHQTISGGKNRVTGFKLWVITPPASSFFMGAVVGARTRVYTGFNLWYCGWTKSIFPVNTNKPCFPLVSKRCKISSTHCMTPYTILVHGSSGWGQSKPMHHAETRAVSMRTCCLYLDEKLLEASIMMSRGPQMHLPWTPQGETTPKACHDLLQAQ